MYVKFEVNGKLTLENVEDDGAALISELMPIETGHSDDESGMFVTIHSWDEDGVHTDFNLLKDKKVKITIEFMD